MVLYCNLFLNKWKRKSSVIWITLPSSTPSSSFSLAQFIIWVTTWSFWNRIRSKDFFEVPSSFNLALRPSMLLILRFCSAARGTFLSLSFWPPHIGIKIGYCMDIHNIHMDILDTAVMMTRLVCRTKWAKCIKRFLCPTLLEGISSLDFCIWFPSNIILKFIRQSGCKKIYLWCPSQVTNPLKKHDGLVSIPRILKCCMTPSLLLHLICLWSNYNKWISFRKR